VQTHPGRRTREEFADLYRREADTVYRVCMLHLNGSIPDAEDAVQTTFLKLLHSTKRFESLEHERACCIVTAANVCRTMLKSGWRRRIVPDDERIQREPAPPAKDSALLEAVMALPEKIKLAVYLFYYEGYACREIAAFLGKSEAAVWHYLHEGRKLLRQACKED